MIGLNESGPVQDIITQDAFEIHDTMFSVKDVIQCLFLCSKSMHDLFHSDKCNIFIVTISTENAWVMGMPMYTNQDYNERVCRNTEGDTAQSNVQNRRNTYLIKDENKYMLFLTKGYILDNFTVKDSYHDFKIAEDKPHVMIHAADIESLTVKNPTLE